MKKSLLLIVFYLFSLIFSLKAQTLSFTEVAQQLGVAHIDKASGGAAWGDYDNDGDSDLYVTSLAYSLTGPQNLNRLFRNDVNTGGVFVDVALQLGIDEAYPDSRSATWCDVNADGWLDLLVCNNSFTYPDSNKLFINTGGQFTNQAGAYGVGHWGSHRLGIWGDYDNDGDQDLYLCVFNYNGGRNRLYRNDDTYFTDVSDIYQVWGDINCTSATWVDYDNDGDQDLYVYNELVPNNLYENRVDQDNTFPDVAFTHALNDSGADGGSTWFDYDNDGDLDLFLSNSLIPTFPFLDPPSKIYRNDLNSSDQFTELTIALGFGDTLSSSGCATGDYDLDGDLDLYLSVLREKNKYYRNDINTSGVFTKIENQMGLSDTLFSLGSSCSDYDGDGDLDIYVVNWPGIKCLLYRNDIDSPNYLKVRLLDRDGNRNRFGSRVKIYYAGTDSLFGMRVVDGGGSGGRIQNEYDCHFGLDPNLAYDIEVIFTTRSNGQNHIFNKYNRPELGGVVPTQIGHFLEIRDSVVTVTGLPPGTKPKAIKGFKLYQNYPNPFNNTTTISFQIEKKYYVKIVIFDLTGKKVITLLDNYFQKGFYETDWNGKNEKGGNIASGIYICQLLLDNKLLDVRTMSLIR